MKKILILTLMTSLCLFTSVQAVDVYDLATSFIPNDSSNPNGPWSFGRRASVFGADSFVYNTAYWNGWNKDGLENIWFNETNPVPDWSLDDGGWPIIWHRFSDQITHVQAGVNSSDYGVVRWTAPSEGLLNIDISVIQIYGTFEAVILLDSKGDEDPNTWIIYDNVNSASYTWTGHHVMAGDTIDIVIAAGEYSVDESIQANFTLYAIGEPGAPEENNIPSPGTPDTFDPDDPDAVWDVSRQFSTVNPGAYWAYGWGSGLDDFNLLDTFMITAEGNPMWYPAGMEPAQFPQMWKNLKLMAWGVPYNTLSAHTSPTLSAKARWTSVIEDVVACAGSFGAGDSGAVDLFIVKDGSQVLLEAYGVTGNLPFDVRMAVVPGTTIDFVVAPGVNYYSDNTPLNIQITRSELRCQDLETHLPTDLNQDCYINLEDFALFAQDWLKCNDPLDPACTDVP